MNKRGMPKWVRADKKGMLLAEETLKIVISLIAIGFLVYFLASLYFNSTYGSELKQATASVERIKEVSLNIQILSEDVFDITPSKWILLSYVGNPMPNSCLGESCICICPSSWFNQESKCDSKGVCSNIEGLEYFSAIKLKSPGATINVLKTEGRVEIYEK